MNYQMRSLRLTMIMLIVALATSALAVQGPPQQKDMSINAEIRKEVIDGALKGLNERYVFPETAKKMEAAVRERVEKKEYDNISSAMEFVRKLTADLRDVSHDKHLSVGYSYEAWPVQPANSGPTPEERAQRRKQMQMMNYAFEKVERLPGNIGYIDFRGFFDPDSAGDTIAAAMNFVANTDALIFDMRKNGGGEPAMVCLVCSYLFGEPVHLNDIYWRPDDSTKQYWTLPHVSGKRYLDKDVYVLTSHFTFSGAEEFTYNLKNLKRATIIGEVTGGGAHPGGPVRINDHFFVRVPAGRAINPITKTNWEGTGVKPDLEVPADKALRTAHVMALKKSIEKATDPDQKAELTRVLERLESEGGSASKSTPFGWTVGSWQGQRKDGKDGTEFRMTMNVRPLLGGAAMHEEMEVWHPKSTYHASAVTAYDTARKVWQMQYFNDVAGKFVPMDAEIEEGKVSWHSVNPNRTRESKLVYEHPGPNAWKRTQYASEDGGKTWNIIFTDNLTRL